MPAEAGEQADTARRELLASEAALPEGGGAPETSRVPLVLEPGDADPRALGEALGLSLYEAQQRVRRGGYQLLRVAAQADAEAEAGRLSAAGLKVHLLSAAEVRAALEPVTAIGGAWTGTALSLRTGVGRLALAPGSLLLVVKGPIAREHALDASWLASASYSQLRSHRFSLAAPQAGLRFHLHRREDPRPVELDPDDFERDADAGGAPSALLAVAQWVAAAAGDTPVDEGFRHVTAALGPSASEAAGVVARIGDSLARTRAASGPGAVLDNLAQFRFYSAWRAALERRRRA